MAAAGLLVMLLCCLFVRYNGVEGSRNLWEQEDLELEKRLKLLNKPSSKTIRDGYGNIYDCVNFYKQPAFDHPLLKNHTYTHNMKPKFINEERNEIESNGTISFGLKKRRCPAGTVPIKRITKEDLMREKRALQETDFGGSRVAVARVVLNDTWLFTGAYGYISLYNPIPAETQSTAARIHLQNGKEFIQFGWRVDPTLYGDTQTHLFIQTRTISTQCFDVQCGFVVTNRDLSPGYIYPPEIMSVRNKRIFETRLMVEWGEGGQWWLSIGSDRRPVGFWPGELFSELSNYASYVDYGGEVSSPHYVPAPAMGNGFKPDKAVTNSFAYIRQATVFDLLGKDRNPQTEPFTDDQNERYNVIDQTTDDPTFGHLVCFGGNSV